MVKALQYQQLGTRMEHEDTVMDSFQSNPELDFAYNADGILLLASRTCLFGSSAAYFGPSVC